MGRWDGIEGRQEQSVLLHGGSLGGIPFELDGGTVLDLIWCVDDSLKLRPLFFLGSWKRTSSQRT